MPANALDEGKSDVSQSDDELDSFPSAVIRVNISYILFLRTKFLNRRL